MKTIFYIFALFISISCCFFVNYIDNSIIKDRQEIDSLHKVIGGKCYQSGYIDGIKASKDSCSFYYYEDRFKSDSLKFVKVFNN